MLSTRAKRRDILALSAKHQKVKHLQLYQAPFHWTSQSIGSEREAPSAEVYHKMLPAWSWMHNLTSLICPPWEMQHWALQSSRALPCMIHPRICNTCHAIKAVGVLCILPKISHILIFGRQYSLNYSVWFQSLCTLSHNATAHINRQPCLISVKGLTAGKGGGHLTCSSSSPLAPERQWWCTTRHQRPKWTHTQQAGRSGWYAAYGWLFWNVGPASKIIIVIIKTLSSSWWARYVQACSRHIMQIFCWPGTGQCFFWDYNDTFEILLIIMMMLWNHGLGQKDDDAYKQNVDAITCSITADAALSSNRCWGTCWMNVWLNECTDNNWIGASKWKEGANDQQNGKMHKQMS